MMSTEKGKGSKVEHLPLNSYSKKHWWYLESRIGMTYDPTSVTEIYYFGHKRISV